MSSDNATNGPHSSSGNSTDSSQSDSASHSEAQNGDLSDRRWLDSRFCLSFDRMHDWTVLSAVTCDFYENPETILITF